jgi:hypothetical protein
MRQWRATVGRATGKGRQNERQRGSVNGLQWAGMKVNGRISPWQRSRQQGIRELRSGSGKAAGHNR